MFFLLVQTDSFLSSQNSKGIQTAINSNKMPVKCEVIPPPSQSKQLGFPKTLLYNGSKFEGSQKSKGNSYAVEVVLQVFFLYGLSCVFRLHRDF